MFSITPLKKLTFSSIAVFVLTLFPATTAQATQSKSKKVKIRARITYYSTGEDKWGARNADPKSKRSKVGVTVAAHPRFKFGTKLFIPKLKGIIGDGDFIVQDRGGAVTRKVASKGKHYVFDVYVTPSQRRKYENQLSEYMDVYIIQ